MNATPRQARRFQHAGITNPPGDLYGIMDNRLVLSIPYITTQAEQRLQKRRIVILISVAAVALIVVVAGTYFFMPPLDLMIAKARVGLFR